MFLTRTRSLSIVRSACLEERRRAAHRGCSPQSVFLRYPRATILECELQHQLNDPRRRERVLDAAECRGVRDVGRTSLDREVRVVEQIERLDSEREEPLVIDGEVLSESEVYVPVSRTVKDSDAGITKLSRRRALEAGDIDPRVVHASAGNLAVADPVWPLERSRRLERLSGAVIYGDR